MSNWLQYIEKAAFLRLKISDRSSWSGTSGSLEAGQVKIYGEHLGGILDLWELSKKISHLFLSSKQISTNLNSTEKSECPKLINECNWAFFNKKPFIEQEKWGCMRIPLIPDTHSEAKRPFVPGDSGRLFRSIPDTPPGWSDAGYLFSVSSHLPLTASNNFLEIIRGFER